MDPIGLFLLSPQAGLRAMALQDDSGMLQAAQPILAQLLSLNEPLDPLFADDPAADLALITSAPSVSRALFGSSASARGLDGLAALLASTADPMMAALFEGEAGDPLVAANPVDRVMAHLSAGDVKHLPH